MADVRDRWDRSYPCVLTAAAACCVLTGCSLVTAFDVEPDAGGRIPDVEERDAAGSPQEEDESEPDETSADASDTQTAVDAGAGPVIDATPDRGSDSADDSAPEAGSAPAGGAAPAPGADPPQGQPPGGGPAPDAGSDPGEGRPSVGDLIDALGGERKGRTDRVCRCPGAGQDCVRAGLGKSSCLERGLELLSGSSEESVRALLECLVPAERAYTTCVDRRLNCRAVESSMTTCTFEYELATARCNGASIQGLSLQSLCSR